MKLLFVISSLDTGGAQRALSNLVCNLPEDWEIEILINDEESVKYPYRGRLLSLGLKKSNNRMSILYQTKVAFRRLGYLRKIKKRNGYDACISFMESANFANILTGKKHCRVILSERNNLSMSSSNSSVYRLICVPLVRLLYNRADKIICVSKSVMNDLSEKQGIKTSLLDYIHNGVDLDKIGKKKARTDEFEDILSNDVMTYITMGRLTKQKGQWHLIRAFKQILDRCPDSGLLILGDGPYREELTGMISELGMADKVRILGFVDNPYAVMDRCDVFAFPSVWEGFSNAIIEAMACGLPVITTDHDSGAREIVAPNTAVEEKNENLVEYAEYGVLVPTGSGIPCFDTDSELTEDERLLAEAMCCLYEKESVRKKYAGLSLQRAEQLSVRAMAEKWKKAIEDIA